MTSLIIDGYNLIGVLHKDMEAERQKLIEALIEYKGRKGLDITVVFDGWKGGGMTEGRAVTGGVVVVYSALGEKADLVIKKAVSRQGRQWIVITSDRDIQGHAWAEGSVPVDAGDFLRILEKQVAGHGPEEPEEQKDFSFPTKGRKLSKKDRAVRKALSKL